LYAIRYFAAWLSAPDEQPKPRKRPRGDATAAQAMMLAYLAAEHVRDFGKPGSVAAYLAKALPLIGAERFAAAFVSYAREWFGLSERVIAQALTVVRSAERPVVDSPG
jgi:hypothetical protein